MSTLPPTHSPRRALLWPAVLVTILTGMGFAGLKFVLIGEIALGFDPAHPPIMPFVWLDDVLHSAIAKGTLKEAITQGLAHRETRRNAHAEAKAAASGVNAAGEVDLDKVAIPANLKGLVEEEKTVVKKRTSRTTGAKKSAVTTDEV